MTSAIDQVKIFMEYMPGGSISSILKTFGPLTEDLMAKFLREIISGLQYLHNRGVLHRDLKGANILVSNDGVAKLADFGASVHFLRLPQLASDSELCDSLRGSVYWMAPEMVKKEKYGRKVDIWSLGCVVIEMATACHPWPNIKNYATFCLNMLSGNIPEIPEHLSEDCRDLVRICLQHQKSLRPSCEELLGHPFLSH